MQSDPLQHFSDRISFQNAAGQALLSISQISGVGLRPSSMTPPEMFFLRMTARLHACACWRARKIFSRRVIQLGLSLRVSTIVHLLLVQRAGLRMRMRGFTNVLLQPAGLLHA
eukprot:COSAG01_NODE_1016_length_12112_cov_6.912178_10_plen_113_part_00